MPPICKYFISLVICAALGYPAFSQAGKDKKNKPAPADTIKNKFVPHGLRIGTDVITLLKANAGSKNFKGWEINFDTDFSRYYLAVDYGNWARTLSLSNGTYQNNGHYFRIGTDVNFMLKDKDRNMFFLGFRYGHASFNEGLQYTSTVHNFNSYQFDVSNPSVKGSWAELTTGLKVKIWRGFWMGYTARFKFSPSTKGNDALKTFDMPGYGLVSQTTYWGFNYQLFWRFGWKKWPPIPPKK